MMSDAVSYEHLLEDAFSKFMDFRADPTLAREINDYTIENWEESHIIKSKIITSISIFLERYKVSRKVDNDKVIQCEDILLSIFQSKNKWDLYKSMDKFYALNIHRL